MRRLLIRLGWLSAAASRMISGFKHGPMRSRSRSEAAALIRRFGFAFACAFLFLICVPYTPSAVFPFMVTIWLSMAYAERWR